MRYIPLPWLTARHGQPVLAAVEVFAGADELDEAASPEGALILPTRWPSSRFMSRIPGEVPGGACYEALSAEGQRRNRIAWEEWVDLFLAHVIVSPRLLPSEVSAALGADRDVLAVVLLRMWLWIDDPAWEQFARAREVLIRPPFPEAPSPAMQEALWFMAKTYKQLPSAILSLSFPELVFNYRITLAAVKKRPADVQGEAMLERIGVEH